MSWAQESLPEEYINSYNNLVDKGDPLSVRLALAGLQAAYDAVMDQKVNYLPAEVPPITADVFRSQAEVVEAMSDPRMIAILLIDKTYLKSSKEQPGILMTVTTNEHGQQNLFAKEPPMTIMEVTETHNEKAEKLNGRVAMLGVMAALGAYALTGQIIPGIW